MSKKNITLGCNYFNGIKFGGLNSTYTEILDENILIQIEGGIGDIRRCTIGNISGAYEMLSEKIKNNNNLTFDIICNLVCETVWEYFGDVSCASNRLDYFPCEDDIDELGQGKIADLNGKNAAMCVERAALAHNLLKSLDINSTYKFSEIEIDSRKDCHCYNLIERENRYYLFDASLITKKNEKIAPLLVEIPWKFYQSIITTEHNKSEYSVDISFYSPVKDMLREVVYFPGGKNLISYDFVSETEKKRK